MFVRFGAAPLIGAAFFSYHSSARSIHYAPIADCRFTIAVFNVSLTNLSQNFSFSKAAICVNTIDNNFPDKSNEI
jgi:hypothetical protein